MICKGASRAATGRTADPPSAPVGGQPGGDAVEHDVQAELEAFRAGRQVVRVDARLREAREPRVPPGGVDPLARALGAGPEQRYWPEGRAALYMIVFVRPRGVTSPPQAAASGVRSRQPGP